MSYRPKTATAADADGSRRWLEELGPGGGGDKGYIMPSVLIVTAYGPPRIQCDTEERLRIEVIERSLDP